ncbi:hypothetical protein QUB70_03115 [Microcoleus sp. A003_D6]
MMPPQMKRAPTLVEPVNEAIAHPPIYYVNQAIALHRTHVKLYLSCRIETVKLLRQN